MDIIVKDEANIIKDSVSIRRFHVENKVEITLNYYRGFPIVTINGEVGYRCKDKLEQINQQIEFSPLIIVDLTTIGIFDSTIIRWLLTRREKYGSIILLVAKANQINKMLKIAGLLPFFIAFDTLEATKDVLDKLIEIAKHEA